MRLYLIRHGKARRHSETGRDEDRRLADQGVAQAAWLGRTLRAAEQPPVRLLASPAARAWETAELVGAGLGVEPEMEGRLGLGASASSVVEMISELSGSARGAGGVALVGHNPTLSVVAQALCRGPGGDSEIDLRTGQAAVLDLVELDSPLGGARLVEMLRGESA